MFRKRRKVINPGENCVSTDQMEVGFAQCLYVQPFGPSTAGWPGRVSNRVVQVESVDEKNSSIHGLKKKPPDRNPEEASGPQPD
jgi:hypothetical protein